jgi:regulatory protein
MNEITTPGTITCIERQIRRRERISVWINDQFAFGIAEETWVRFSLFTGRTLTSGEIMEIREWDEIYQAKQTGMRYLERRRRSRKEVRRRLVKKEYSESAIEAAIRFFEEYGMVDDEAFARAWVHDRLLRKKVGRQKLVAELSERGVDRELVNDVLAEVLDVETSRDHAMEAARSKERRLRKSDPIARERSIVTFLKSRGFGWEEIRPVIEELREEWREENG